MVPYRLYFLDAEGAIQARQEFAADNDAQAKLISATLWRACDESYPDYELWQATRCLGRGNGDSGETIAALLEFEDALVQMRVLELEERLLESHWRVAKSKQLLASVETLRRRIDGTVPTAVTHEAVQRYICGKTGTKMMSLQLAEGMRLMLRGSRGFTRRFDEFFAVVATGHCACGVAFENARQIVVPAIDSSPIFAGQEALDVLRAEGVASCVSTPLLDGHSRIAGMFSIHRDRVWRPLEGELAHLRQMASEVAAALADPFSAAARMIRAAI